MRLALVLLSLLAAGSPAGAQVAAQAGPGTAERPPMVPAREASVLYRMTAAGVVPTEVRITTRAGGSPMRIDLPDRSYMLIDQAARRLALVVPDEQMVLDAPYESGPQAQFVLNERMRFTRRSPDTVATVRCTNWDVAVDKGRGTMCINDDGIILRIAGQDQAGRRSLIEAVSVSFTPAPAAEFVVPPDFDRMAARPNGPVSEP